MDVDHPVSNLIEADGFVIASATDLGRKRTGNEDSHALWIADDAATRAERGLLLVVCDGMGGASAGEVASQLAVQTVAQRFRATLDEDPDVALRNAINRGEIVGPRMLVATHGVGATGGHFDPMSGYRDFLFPDFFDWIHSVVG